MGSEIVTKGSHPMRAKRLSNPKCCRWAKFIFLPATTFLWTKCCLYLWYSSTEVKKPVSNLAFRRASAWPSWEAWAGRLPSAFDAPLSLLGAMKHYKGPHLCQNKANERACDARGKRREPTCDARWRRTTAKPHALGPKCEAAPLKTHSEGLQQLESRPKWVCGSSIGGSLRLPEDNTEEIKRGMVF